MKSTLQLHALSSELQSWVNGFLERHHEVQQQHLQDAKGNLYSIILSARNDVSTNSNNLLRIIIGAETSSGLRQSSISFCASNDESSKKWKEFIKIAKKNSIAGLITVGADGIKRGEERRFRFTKGASDYFCSGKNLLAFAGNVKHIPSSTFPLS